MGGQISRSTPHPQDTDGETNKNTTQKANIRTLHNTQSDICVQARVDRDLDRQARRVRVGGGVGGMLVDGFEELWNELSAGKSRQ